MESKVWPKDKRAALTLCYDGGWSGHLRSARPLLNSLDIRASFFLSPTLLLDDPVEWRATAMEGHELGSHSLFNVTERGALFNWTQAMVADDLDLTNELFREILSVTPQSFALPGWSTYCADGDYLEAARSRFAFVRSERRESNNPTTFDPGFLGSFPLDAQTDELASSINVAIKQGDWIILRMEHLPENHEELIRSLALHSDLWIAPLHEVGCWLRNRVGVAHLF